MAELQTGPSVQVQDGPVLVQEGFEPRTELFLYGIKLGRPLLTCAEPSQ